MDEKANLTIACHTLGCKVNRYETDAVLMRFLDAGFREVPFEAKADVYLINTCTVTAEADRKTRQILRRARHRNPEAVVAAMGCHVELAGAEGLADVRIGCGERMRIVDEVLSALADRTAPLPGDGHLSLALPSDVFEEIGPVVRQSETRAYVKIQDGCDDFCSYCAIPFARGRSRSRARASVLEEVRALSGAGFAEVVLTGIHIGVYGRDLGEGPLALADLVRDVAAVEGIRRIRLGSLDPQSMTPDFVQALRGIPALCPHFHLSLQSGSASILARMDRRYTPDDFVRLVHSLRDVFPDAGITTDIMTGFPGETEAEHVESLAFCDAIAFSRMHVFRYSRRPRTRAASLPGQVPARVAMRRADELSALAERMSTAFACRMDGMTRGILIEKVESNGTGEGYTPEYMHVTAHGLEPSCKGRIVPCRLSFSGSATLDGSPAGDSRTDVSQTPASW